MKQSKSRSRPWDCEIRRPFRGLACLSLRSDIFTLLKNGSHYGTKPRPLTVPMECQKYLNFEVIFEVVLVVNLEVKNEALLGGQKRCFP